MQPQNSAPRSPEIFIAVRFVSKLSTEQWAEARRLYGRGATFTAIATQFDITRGAVAKRARREGWVAPLNGPVGGVGSTGTAHAQDDFRWRGEPCAAASSGYSTSTSRSWSYACRSD